MGPTRWSPGPDVRVLVVGHGTEVASARDTLAAAGYVVRAAADGAAALAALAGSPGDLVLVDWRLPDSTGLALCQAIRDQRRLDDLYLILLAPERAEWPAAAADDYLRVPFDEVHLLIRARAGARSAELHRSEARLRTLIANAPGAIYRCANDSDWTMELISDDIERISGYPASDFIGSAKRSFASVIHPDDRAQVEHDVTAATDQGRLFILEYRIVRRDGGISWVRERGQQVNSASGRSWLDGVIFDISEWKAAEERLRRSQRLLAIAEDRDRIGRDLHDGVVQALSGVRLTLQAADAVADRPEAVRDRLADSVERIDRAIEEIRDYVYDLRPALWSERRLHEAIYRLAEDFQRSTGIVTAIDLDPAVAAMLEPAAGEVMQLVREALSNLRRHAHATTCRVGLARDGETAVLEIDDDGQGFDRRRAAAGAGQGLRNMAERAARLAGRLDVVSGAEGTTVTARLPLPADS
jgi:PAS domain S-box-containing protein